MKILIMGAGGFIGSTLTRKLLNNSDYEITVFDRPEADLSFAENAGARAVRGYFSPYYDFKTLTENQDIVFHLINIGNPSTSNVDIENDIAANVLPSQRLIDACADNGVKKFVYFSSGGTVYGNPKTVPVKEDYPLVPICSYGLEKVLVEQILQFRSRISKMGYSIVRLGNPYGPGQNPRGNQGIVTIFTYRALNSLPITIYGDGSVVRDYIYIDDAVNMVINTAMLADSGIYNIGSGIGRSINDIVEAIDCALDIKIKINRLPARNVDADRNILDVSNYVSKFGTADLVGIHDGIIKTADFLRRANFE